VGSVILSPKQACGGVHANPERGLVRYRHVRGTPLSELIRYRYNTKADETPGGEWKWRVVFERGDQYEEVLVKQLLVNVPSFSRDDIMPIVGPKYHMACYGAFRLEDGVGIIDAK
jgi:hypothetical protein